MIEIREEFPPDFDAVDAVVMAAFGRRTEADLVRALRDEDCIVLNLVVETHGRVVGHVSFSELPIDTGKRILRERRWLRCPSTRNGSVEVLARR